jgi:hypothetical protein
LNIFTFDNSEKDKRILLNKLEHIGLELVEERQEYNQRVWTLKCRWLINELNVIWLQRWVNDGMNLDDFGVKLTLGETTLDEFLFESLLDHSAGVPLRALIIQRIVHTLSETTGKRT